MNPPRPLLLYGSSTSAVMKRGRMMVDTLAVEIARSWAVAYAFEIVKGRRVYARDVQRALTIRLRQFDHSASLWQDSRTMPGLYPRSAKSWDPDCDWP